MRDAITHKGKIIKVGESNVTVRITPTSDDCARCAIASLCTKPEELSVSFPNATPELIGKEVTIAAPYGLRQKATVLFLIAPVILLIAVLCLLICFGVSEDTASLTAIGIVVLWYVALYCARIKIRHNTGFKIISID